VILFKLLLPTQYSTNRYHLTNHASHASLFSDECMARCLGSGGAYLNVPKNKSGLLIGNRKYRGKIEA
jgi:hypothetical protein